ncbi:helix-turn-helix transcriptional regulator [Seonamhaeicola marinus]|uniref:Helix-turn-helix transcriptional regulator n=1 Tax=Seonamhaeicola marinus TaxID=1912246 RepID=A0A5D0HUM6_9FLAO|nr:helix-turn-helix transcriptional regulator [Seonamhaeicola marinus]
MHEFYCVEYLKNSEFLLEFGRNLKKIRKSKGFTQAELANDIGIEISQISRIERGIINTSISTSYEISKALKIDIGELFNFQQKS